MQDSLANHITSSINHQAIKDVEINVQRHAPMTGRTDGVFNLFARKTMKVGSQQRGFESIEQQFNGGFAVFVRYFAKW